jgi:hypothetical protein
LPAELLQVLCLLSGGCQPRLVIVNGYFHAAIEILVRKKPRTTTLVFKLLVKLLDLLNNFHLVVDCEIIAEEALFSEQHYSVPVLYTMSDQFVMALLANPAGIKLATLNRNGDI